MPWRRKKQSEPEELYVIRPAAPIVNHMEEFLETYAKFRRDIEEPKKALEQTIGYMLRDDRAAMDELGEFVSGKYDARYDVTGKDFLQQLLDSGERFYQDVKALPGSAKATLPSTVFDQFRQAGDRLSSTEVMDFMSYGEFNLEDADRSVPGVINWLTEETKDLASRRAAVSNDDLYTDIANQMFAGYGVGRFVLGTHKRVVKYGTEETGSHYQARLMELVSSIENGQMEAAMAPSVGEAVSRYDPPPVITRATADAEEAFKLATFAILEGLKIAIAEQEMLASR